MNYRQRLNAIRQALGNPTPLLGRNWGKIASRDLIPSMNYEGDPLLTLWKDQSLLLKSGRVVWAAVIQANGMLFEPGNYSLPGEVVIGVDTSLDDNPEPLAETASRIFAIKGTQPQDPELRIVADRITNEIHRSLAEVLPMQITNGLALKRYTVVFHQPHLPFGFLNGKVLPVLVHASSKHALIVPSWYWPEEMKMEWEPSSEQRDYFAERNRERSAGPIVQITHDALTTLRQLIQQNAQPGEPLYVRLTKEQGRINLCLDPDKQGEDVETTVEGIKVLINANSVEACRGCTVDFCNEDGGPRGFSVTRA